MQTRAFVGSSPCSASWRAQGVELGADLGVGHDVEAVPA